jgi:hypothetical protein
MVEADSHLKLHPPSILNIFNLAEQIDMLSIGIQLQPYTVIHPHSTVASTTSSTLLPLLLLAPSSLSCWHCFLHCTNVVTPFALALFSLLCWHCHFLKHPLPLLCHLWLRTCVLPIVTLALSIALASLPLLH